jgi:endonuclease G
MPAADQIIVNRHYTIGYSYYFRQAKWALEIIDPDKTDVERFDNFRPDLRVPELFRADLADYEGSGFDRGHLVASANQVETEIQNSETFLLSNMSPQMPGFNRGIWKDLEDAVRKLDAQKNVLETYVICGPIFNFDVPVVTIVPKKNKGVTLPIPHAYFKSVLTEDNRGKLHMWTFMIPNEATDKHLEEFLTTTKKIERYSGLTLWERLVGREIEKEKTKIRAMWKV